MRRRIQAIAHERSLPPDEIAKALTCRTFDVVQFAKRHRVNCDWLIFGDLKGLLETVRGVSIPAATANSGRGFGVMKRRRRSMMVQIENPVR
jgi:hypothetical protein